MSSNSKIAERDVDSESISLMPNPNEQPKCANVCKYIDLLLENYTNLKQSGSPVRIMFYDKVGWWVDFPSEVVDSLREGFTKGVIEVRHGGNRYLFDLFRMLQIDLRSGNQRSIAWIDVDGKSFFPRTSVGGGREFVNVPQNPNVEILKVTKELESEIPKVKNKIRMGGNLDSGKTKEVVVEIDCEAGKMKKLEGNSSKDQPRGMKSPLVDDPGVGSTKLSDEGESKLASY